MSRLGERLRDMIAAEGPMPLEHFMALALGDPRDGYYMTRDPFGSAGDFVTAPEMSQMFGELLGLWSAEAWAALGSPEPCLLIELGPGRGTLMADALRAARVAPKFRAALSVHLVETSPVLRARQEATLAGAGVPLAWHDRLADVPPGPAIVLANEFFDALPVRHYLRGEGGWHERLVGLGAGGGLIFGVAPEPEAAIGIEAPAGSILEVGAMAHRVMSELAARLAAQGGAALVIDYGHAASRLGETLQALKGHRPVDPLEAPGEADLTTHVDFAALGRAARAAGARVFGPVEQGEFLLRLGIGARAEALKRRANPEQAKGIDAALRRLVGREPEPGAAGRDVPGMGALFKVMAVAGESAPVPAGFRESEDMR